MKEHDTFRARPENTPKARAAAPQIQEIFLRPEVSTVSPAASNGGREASFWPLQVVILHAGNRERSLSRTAGSMPWLPRSLWGIRTLGPDQRFSSLSPR